MKIKLIGLVGVIVILVGYFYATKVSKKKDAVILQTTLPINDTEKIVVDPATHKIRITTQKGTTSEYLPSRPSEIEVRKDGKIVVTASQWGVEHAIFAGVGFSSLDLRIALGVDLVYFKRVDVGLFVSDETKDLTKPRIGVILNYTFWHDTRLGLGVDDKGSPTVLLSERF